jgi:hypothetical protein
MRANPGDTLSNRLSRKPFQLGSDNLFHGRILSVKKGKLNARFKPAFLIVGIQNDRFRPAFLIVGIQNTRFKLPFWYLEIVTTANWAAPYPAALSGPMFPPK